MRTRRLLIASSNILQTTVWTVTSFFLKSLKLSWCTVPWEGRPVHGLPVAHRFLCLPFRFLFLTKENKRKQLEQQRRGRKRIGRNNGGGPAARATCPILYRMPVSLLISLRSGCLLPNRLSGLDPSVRRDYAAHPRRRLGFLYGRGQIITRTSVSIYTLSADRLQKQWSARGAAPATI
jgi:hypothetical protein